MTTTALAIGDIVCPRSNGEDASGRILHWKRLRGRVVDIWDDCGEARAKVRWFRSAPYPSQLPADWLALA
jgi:hypothetical protein